MKSQLKTIGIVFLVSCFFFSTYSQINLLSSGITFRSYSTATSSTIHYGDLTISGGSSGASWGWLNANKVNCYGPLYVQSSATCAGGLTVYGSFYATGAKHFIQPHPTDSTKLIKYISIEAGEALTIARGVAKT